MRSFNKLFVVVILLMVAVFIGTNLYLFSSDSESGRPYKVEIGRVVHEIEEKGYDHIDLSNYAYITCIERFSDDENTFYESDSDYAVRVIDGEIYRIDYIHQQSVQNRNVILAVNVILAILLVLVIILLIYIRHKILLPFQTLTEIPYELSKGNLTIPLKEHKNRFFGRFVWGVDMLRENIEDQKQHELALQKEKKTLLLSISHDIKTPLSAIKLYSKALSKELYPDKAKQLEIAENINTKADEIEAFVSQLVKASNEDFLNLEVNNTEFYLSNLVKSLSVYYQDKLALVRTEFVIDQYSDCLLKGDFDRSIEVLQNILENAIKYGDGQEIELSFSEEDGCMLITVKNSGCILPEQELPHIFDSFWRGSNAENNSGSGLGLYICRQLMNKMNGEIFAEIKEGSMYVTTVFVKA